jgi:ribonuclease BN (tRNA processing enzyme)
VYDVRELTAGSRDIGPFRVVTDRVNHPVETYAVRLECGGRTLAYSADTGESPALVDLARNADLLLCEASYLDGRSNPPNLHLTGRQAGEHATKAEVSRLLLTHLVQSWGDPACTLAEATGAFDGPVRLVRPGDGYDI